MRHDEVEGLLRAIKSHGHLYVCFQTGHALYHANKAGLISVQRGNPPQFSPITLTPKGHYYLWALDRKAQLKRTLDKLKAALP